MLAMAVNDSSIRPTDEQQHAIDLARTGARLKIEALAGSGKTSLLEFVAKDRPNTGMLYLAYNKALANEAQGKFPRNVDCRTTHSIAYRTVGGRYRHRLGGRRIRQQDIARFLSIDPLVVDGRRFAPGFLAGQLMAGVRNFCASGDERISPRHLPAINVSVDDLQNQTFTRAVRDALNEPLQDAWRDLESLDGRLPFTHDTYLKLFQLSHPRLGADVVLLDEAQDSSDCVLAIIADQTDAQVVVIGDTYQQLYAWRGAVNAMAKVHTDETAYLTACFRFGPEIAEVGNVALAELGSPAMMVGAGKPGEVTSLNTADAVLCRTNATCLKLAFDAMDAGQRPHIVGGGADLVAFAKGAASLMKTGVTDHPDLAPFRSWAEVEQYVQEDAGGEDMQVMVRLINKFGADRIERGVEACVDEDQADVIFSTAHRSKGRGFSTVKLAGDFPDESEREVTDEEWRLMYVAATRAKRVLDPYDCKPLASRYVADRWAVQHNGGVPVVAEPGRAVVIDATADQLADAVASAPTEDTSPIDQVADGLVDLFAGRDAAPAPSAALAGLHPKAVELHEWLAAHPAASMADAMSAFGWNSRGTIGGYLVTLIEAGLVDVRILTAAAA